MALLIPGLFGSILLCAVTAGIAGATRFISTYLMVFLAGVDNEILIQQALIKSFFNILFSMAGGLAVATVKK